MRGLARICLVAPVLLGLCAACESEYIPPFLGGGGATRTAGGSFAQGAAFTEELVQERTFTDGTCVTTTTCRLNDAGDTDVIPDEEVLLRAPYGIDFNDDGRIDPVVGYGGDQNVIQILLSNPDSAVGAVDYTSLTLDSKRDMAKLADVAVGDVDRDGALDIVAAAEFAVWYFHHPSGQPVTALSAWGNQDPTDELRERIDSSYTTLTDSELQAIITQAMGPGVNLDNYIVTIEQVYRNVELGDMDNDADNDVVAARSFTLTLTPLPDVPVPPIQIVDGDVIVFLNPGYATTGHNWSMVSVGSHERQTRLDRDGARGLLLYDLDHDGDLDVLSAAGTDNNVQVAWFENPVQNRPGAPGRMLFPDDVWSQWRVGSVRDAWGVDIADVTGDGLADVIATGGEQQQLLLFVQPATGPARSYDWNTYVLVTFDSFQPRDVKAVDLDNDDVLELVSSGTEGAVRYYESTDDPTAAWDPFVVVTYNPPGEVGWLGYGDVDGDGDADLVTVIAAGEENASRVTWIRNETIRTD